MSILGVLVLAGAAGILATLWIGAKKRGNAAHDTTDPEMATSLGESAMAFSEK